MLGIDPRADQQGDLWVPGRKRRGIDFSVHGCLVATVLLMEPLGALMSGWVQSHF